MESFNTVLMVSYVCMIVYTAVASVSLMMKIDKQKTNYENSILFIHRDSS